MNSQYPLAAFEFVAENHTIFVGHNCIKLSDRELTIKRAPFTKHE